MSGKRVLFSFGDSLFDALRGYKTVKKVRIHDNRLQALYVVAMLIVLAAVFIQIAGLHQYATFVRPQGTVNAWTGQWKRNPDPHPHYCDNSDYDFIPTGVDFETAGFIAVNYSCPHVVTADIISIGTDTFDVMCAQLRLQGHLAENATEECAGTKGDVCGVVFGDVDNIFVRDAEFVAVNVLHAYSVPWQLTGDANAASTLVDLHGKVMREFPAGQPIDGILISEFLHASGTSLDTKNTQNFVTTRDPYYRNTGVVLLVRFTYSNLRPWDWSRTPKCEISVSRLDTIWGYKGAKNVYRDFPNSFTMVTTTSVILKFIVDGQMGHFSYPATMLALLSGAFLLGIARMLVDFVGTALLPGADRRAFARHKITNVSHLHAVGGSNSNIAFNAPTDADYTDGSETGEEESGRTEEKLREWLTSLGLQEYALLLISSGFDSLDNMHNITAQDCTDIGITKRAHVRRMCDAAQAIDAT